MENHQRVVIWGLHLGCCRILQFEVTKDRHGRDRCSYVASECGSGGGASLELRFILVLRWKGQLDHWKRMRMGKRRGKKDDEKDQDEREGRVDVEMIWAARMDDIYPPRAVLMKCERLYT